MLTDESLRLAVSRWIAVSKWVRLSIENDFPSSQVLVRFALREQLSESDWTSQEWASLKQAESVMADAIANHASLARIISRIQNDAQAFDQAWNASVDSIQAGTIDRAPVARRFSGMRLVRTALSAAAVVVVIAFGINQLTPNATLPHHVIEYAAGESNHVVLEDGSTVRLAENSSLSWDGDFSRTVSLSGSAFFDVDASSEPFFVETEVGVTTVLGTSFGIQTIPSNENGNPTVKVTLVSGRVSLSGQGSASKVLAPGEQGIITRSGITVAPVNLTESLTWTEFLVFRDTPMKEVVAELQRRFEIKIILDKHFTDTPLTGTFDQDRGAKEILNIMATALGAQLSVDAQTGTFSLERSESAGL